MLRYYWDVARSVIALGASAFAAEGGTRTARRLQEWETLGIQDAGEGDACTLSDGTRMHYVVRSDLAAVDARGGCPRDVILIHGLMSSTSEWARNIDALATRYRVWAIDLIGFGFSSRMTVPAYSLRYYAQCLLEFLDAQGIARASIVGHSLGGGTALQFAHDHGDRVDRLILIGPEAYISGLIKTTQFVTRIPYLPRAIGGAVLRNPRVHRAALCNALGAPDRLDEEMLAARTRATQVKGTLDALFAMLASPHASDMPEGLAEITAPALILWGDRDAALPLAHGRRLARTLANAKLVVLPGAGHVPNEEFPDTVNRLMLDFLGKRDVDY